MMNPRLAHAVVLLGLASAAPAQVSSYTNGSGTNLWGTPTNWSPVGVPGGAHTAIIAAGFPPVIAFGETVGLVQAAGPMSFQGGVFNVAGGGFVNDFGMANAAFATGGVLELRGQGSVQSAMSWTVSGTGSYINKGALQVAALPVTNVLLRNEGTITVTGQLTLGGAGAVLQNTADAMLKLLSTAQILSSGRIDNSGSVEKEDATISAIRCRYNQVAGGLKVRAGVLRLEGGADLSGGVAVIDAGSTLHFAPASGLVKFMGILTFAGQGWAIFEAPANTQNPPFQVLQETIFGLGSGLELRSGNTLLDSFMRNTGRATWTGTHALQGQGEFHNEANGIVHVTAAGALPINAGAIFANKGAMTVDGGMVLNSAGFVNEQSGVYQWNGNRPFQGGPTQGTFRNRGQVKKVGGAAVMQAAFEQTNGGKVIVDGGSLTLAGGGELGAGGGRFELSGTGPTLHWSGGTPLVVSEGTHVVTGTGLAEIGPNATIRVEAGATLNLDVDGNPIQGFRVTSGALGGAGLVRNTKTLRVAGALGVNGQANILNFRAMTIASGTLAGTLTNLVGGTVLHVGGLTMPSGTIVNQGDWVFDPIAGGGLLIGATGQFRNENLVVFQPLPPVAGAIQTRFDNQGTVRVELGVMSISGQVAQLQNGALSGGTWIVFPGATLVLPPPLNKITSSARVVGAWSNQQGVQGLPAVTQVAGGGKLETTGDVTFNQQLEVMNGGTLTIRAPSIVTVPSMLYSGWTTATRVDQVSGQDAPVEARLITPVFENSAVAGPGGPAAAGSFNLTGNLHQLPLGELEIEVAGPNPVTHHDQMIVTGSAALAGRLRILLLDGFVPAPGLALTVLTAGAGVTGAFDEVIQPPTMPPGLAFRAIHRPGSVLAVVGPACYPDCNLDGALNLADFGCFQTRFALADPYADCNGDGALNLADFGCFQTKFALACP